jgi:hypothetical protein
MAVPAALHRRWTRMRAVDIYQQLCNLFLEIEGAKCRISNVAEVLFVNGVLHVFRQGAAAAAKILPPRI